MLAFFVGTNVTHFCCSWLLATVLLLNGEKNEQKHLLIFIISSWQQGRGARCRTSPHLTENARPSFGSSASAPSAPLPLGQKHPHSLAHTHMRTKTQCLLTHNSIGVPSLTLPGECKWPCPPPPPRRRPNTQGADLVCFSSSEWFLLGRFCQTTSSETPQAATAQNDCFDRLRHPNASSKHCSNDTERHWRI